MKTPTVLLSSVKSASESTKCSDWHKQRSTHPCADLVGRCGGPAADGAFANACTAVCTRVAAGGGR
eukprot:6892-Heterococcus_DN1.PRE.1